MQTCKDDIIFYKKLFDIIEKNNKFLIITHDFPDGDCLGSQIALFELFKRLKKQVAMFCSSEIPYQYSFLPSVNFIKKDFNSLHSEINCKNKECVCFCLDSADASRFELDLNELKEKISFLINIDHHLGNSMYGDLNIVNPAKSATAEIIYEFMNSYYKDLIDHKIAVGLYTGILTDTGRFQYENTTKNVHKIISHLLEFDIIPSDIYSYIYENEPFERFKLIELVLRRLKVDSSGKLIYSYVLQKDFKRLNLPFSAHDGIIELLRTAAGVKIAALFKQVKNDFFKVSLRSSDRRFSVADIASKFGGGGHKLAAAYSHVGPLNKVIENLIKEVQVI